MQLFVFIWKQLYVVIIIHNYFKKHKLKVHSLVIFAGAFLLWLLGRFEPEREEEGLVRRISAAEFPERLRHRDRAAQRQKCAAESVDKKNLN